LKYSDLATKLQSFLKTVVAKPVFVACNRLTVASVWRQDKSYGKKKSREVVCGSTGRKRGWGGGRWGPASSQISNQ
jgi:hypothetical protein